MLWFNNLLYDFCFPFGTIHAFSNKRFRLNIIDIESGFWKKLSTQISLLLIILWKTDDKITKKGEILTFSGSTQNLFLFVCFVESYNFLLNTYTDIFYRYDTICMQFIEIWSLKSILWNFVCRKIYLKCQLIRYEVVKSNRGLHHKVQYSCSLLIASRWYY